MRTTVTLDPDVESLLRKAVRASGAPFKQVLNEAVRAGLKRGKAPAARFRHMTFDMGKPRADLTKALSLASELEDEELAFRHERTR